MRFGLLGPVLVERDGTTVEVAAAMPRTVLAVLLLNANTVVSSDQLAEALWGEAPPASATASLHNHVMRLRRLLGTRTRIRAVAPGYLIHVEPGELDLHSFTELCAEGRAAAQAGNWAKASENLAAALALWRGTPVADRPGLSGQDARIQHLLEARSQAYAGRIAADLELGRQREVIGELRALAAEHPVRESFHGQLMLALYRADRRTEALEVYQGLLRTLVDELGVEPSPSVQQLHRRILDADPELAAVVRPDRAGPRFQLPADTRAFTGRVHELDELIDLARAAPGGTDAGHGGDLGDRRDGRDRQELAGRARRAPRPGPLSGRPAVHRPARLHGRPGTLDLRRRARPVPAFLQRPPAIDPAGPRGARRVLPGPARRNQDPHRPGQRRLGRAGAPAAARRPGLPGGGDQPQTADRAGRRALPHPGHPSVGRRGNPAAQGGRAGPGARPPPGDRRAGRAVRERAAGHPDHRRPAAPPSGPADRGRGRPTARRGRPAGPPPRRGPRPHGHLRPLLSGPSGGRAAAVPQPRPDPRARFRRLRGGGPHRRGPPDRRAAAGVAARAQPAHPAGARALPLPRPRPRLRPRPRCGRLRRQGPRRARPAARLLPAHGPRPPTGAWPGTFRPACPRPIRSPSPRRSCPTAPAH